MISAADADIYRYVDKNGVEWFVDSRKSVAEQYHDQLKTVITEVPGGKRLPSMKKRSQKKAVPKKTSVRSKKVEIFITDWCPYCRKLEKFLRPNKIKYKRYDIEKNSKGRKKYDRLGKGGVPIIKIGDQVIRGYDPEAILRAIH